MFKTTEELRQSAKNVFKDFNTENYELDSVTFLKIYDELPEIYRIYFNNKGKLTYSRLIDYEYDNRKSKIATIFVDTYKLCKTLMENKDIVVFNNTYTYTYFLHKDFMLAANGVYNEYNLILTVLVRPGTIESVFKFFEANTVSYRERTKASYGVARIDPSSGELETYNYPIDKKLYKYDPKNYNDDFQEVYERICSLIEKDKDPSLMLFYGKPGTGKTSIIKSIIAKYKTKSFVLIDGYMLNSISNSNLMDYFSMNENTVFIIEDCERIIRSRDLDYNNNIMSVLLNVTGGIIGDSLNLKFILTFNTSINDVDKALLRPGRCSLKYEFKPLTKEKAHAIDPDCNTEKTLAELYNKEKHDYSAKNQTRIGF